MSDKDLRLVSRLINRLVFIDGDLVCDRLASLKLDEKEQEAFKAFLELGKITVDEYCNLIKNGKEMDEYDYKTGSKQLIEEYEKLKEEYTNFKKKAIPDPDWDCNSYAKYE